MFWVVQLRPFGDAGWMHISDLWMDVYFILADAFCILDQGGGHCEPVRESA